MIKGLPERLKNLRLQYNLSQKDVSKFIGLSSSIVSGYETGERTPSTEVILKLSTLYHCSTDYLLGNTSENCGLYLNATGLTPEQINSLNVIIDSLKTKS